MSGERLNVIALISGGKDSFYSLLQCVHHGHRIVALANLFPVGDDDDNDSTAVAVIDPDQPVISSSTIPEGGEAPSAVGEKDLNSFMYQTVGHQVIPLFAAATGLPLYRQPILGGAARHERDYDYTSVLGQGSAPAGDETESMIPLLRAVMARHPEANAICSGAILSTYQRTRVESVALRLGLTPLSFLWKYPTLPSSVPGGSADEAQLLRDMAAAGLEARIIKVASAGLDQSHLWERVSSETGVDRIKASLKKFGGAEGASLGEGGEFETLVVDGPRHLFKKRITVPENGRKLVHEGGGSTWLMLQGAKLEDKAVQEPEPTVSIREPALLDATFQSVADSLVQESSRTRGVVFDSSSLVKKSAKAHASVDLDNLRWAVVADSSAVGSSTQHEMNNVVDKIKLLLSTNGLEADQITSVVIVLRDMADFPKLNSEYGKLFTRPNPPSRITISSGGLLPQDRNIVIYVTTPVANTKSTRNGLHVQSRSYWAPANIGPYSQAIETSVLTDGEPTGLTSVLIAGQIPLVPASMALPSASETLLAEQVVLSLQHLWRIASEMKVQCWSSAVAYFSRQRSADDACESARLAGQAWTLAHGSPDEEDDDDNGPDPWDLKYNPRYQSLAGTETKTSCPPVPDWSVYTLRQQNEPGSCIPPVFAAEIESLPRDSLVEWHAHNGLKGIREGCAELIHLPHIGTGDWQGWHMIVSAGDAHVLYTTMAYSGSSTAFQKLQQQLSSVYQESLHRLQPGVTSSGNALPYLGYVDMNKVNGLWASTGGVDTEMPFAVVPCHSLWSSSGERLAAVVLYRTTLTETGSFLGSE